MDAKTKLLLLSAAAGGSVLGLGYLLSRTSMGRGFVPAIGTFTDPELGTELVAVDRGAGNALVLYADRSNTQLMQDTAESAANLLGAERGVANDGQELLDAVDRAPSNLTRVILAGHGGPTQFLNPGRGGLRISPDALRSWVSVPTFISRLAPKLASSGVVISFAGCRSGANPGEADWTPESYVAGGAQSLAAAIRDEIVRVRGSLPDSEVRAKSTTGTSFGNPMGRIFPIDAQFVGLPGIPLTDVVWGRGAALDSRLSSAWRNLTRTDRKMAMGWTLGGDLPEVARPS